MFSADSHAGNEDDFNNKRLISSHILYSNLAALPQEITFRHAYHVVQHHIVSYHTFFIFLFWVWSCFYGYVGSWNYPLLVFLYPFSPGNLWLLALKTTRPTSFSSTSFSVLRASAVDRAALEGASIRQSTLVPLSPPEVTRPLRPLSLSATTARFRFNFRYPPASGPPSESSGLGSDFLFSVWGRKEWLISSRQHRGFLFIFYVLLRSFLLLTFVKETAVEVPAYYRLLCGSWFSTLFRHSVPCFLPRALVAVTQLFAPLPACMLLTE